MLRKIFLFFLIPALALAQEDVSPDYRAQIGALTAKITELTLKVNELTARDVTKKRSAKDSCDKAQQLRAARQYQSAGIYFGNALAIEPDNLTILNEYTNNVLEWVASRQAVGDYASAESTLNDYIRYLYTYPAGLDLIGADWLESTFWTLADFREKLTREATDWRRAEQARERAALRDSIQAVIAGPVPDNESALNAEFYELQDLAVRWAHAAPDGIDIMEKLSDRREVISNNLEALSLLATAETAMKSGTQDNITNFYRTNELYLVNRRLANLSPSLSGRIRERAAKFGADLAHMEGAVSEDNSRSVWDSLFNTRRREAESAAAKAKTREAAITVWVRFAEEVSLELSRTRDPLYAANMRALLADTAARTGALREEQLKLYEVWSLKNIRTLYDDYNGEIGLLSGGKAVRDRIAGGMKDYLCPIDTRYLSVTGIKLYSDIYDFFNKELDRSTRISIAIDFNNCAKKPLGDF